MVWPFRLNGEKNGHSVNGHAQRTPDLSCLGLGDGVNEIYRSHILPHLSKSEQKNVETRIERMVLDSGALNILVMSFLEECAQNHQFGKGSRKLQKYLGELGRKTTSSDRERLEHQYMAEAMNYIRNLDASINRRNRYVTTGELAYTNIALHARES